MRSVEGYHPCILGYLRTRPTVSVIQTAKRPMLIVPTAFTDRPSQSHILSISSVNSGRFHGKSVSMDVHPLQSIRLSAPGLPSSSACDPPIKSAAIFGDPAAFLLPLFGTSSPTKEGPQRTQSPVSPCPPQRNLTTANAPLPLSEVRVPSSAPPEALKFPQLRPEGLDPNKKGLTGNIGALLLGSKRPAEDDGDEGDIPASTESVGGCGSRKRPCRPISRAKVCAHFVVDVDRVLRGPRLYQMPHRPRHGCGRRRFSPVRMARKTVRRHWTT